LKILCVSQRFFPSVGGAEQVAKNYMDFLSKNHEITVYTTNAYELNSFWDEKGTKIMNPTMLNYEIKRYDILTPNNISQDLYKFPFSISSPGPFCPTMWKDLLNMKNRFDLIIVSAFPYDHVIPAVVASKKFNIPLIIIPHLHLEFPYSYFTGLRLSLLDASDILVVNTNEEKKVLENFKIDYSKIHIISPGIDTSIKSETIDLRKKLNIDQKSLVVLFGGTKSKEKGLLNLIETLKKLWDKQDIKLVIFGPSTKDFEYYFKKQSQKTKNNIIDLGLISDGEKCNAFSSCDILAVPSRAESFGIIYLEAWLHKKPVIGCNIPAVCEIIDNEENGILVNFDDHIQLSDAILKLSNPKLRKKLGENGFKKLIERYDSKKLCQEFEDLCIKIVSK